MFCAERISSRKSLRARDRGASVRRFVGCGRCQRPVTRRRLHQAKLPEVSREGRLSHPHAQVPELAAQLILAGHRLARKELQNLPLPKSFLDAHCSLRCVNMQPTA